MFNGESMKTNLSFCRSHANISRRFDGRGDKYFFLENIAMGFGSTAVA